MVGRASGRRSPGFTLIELVVVLTILPMLIVTIAAIWIHSARVMAEVENRRTAERGLRTALAWIGKDVRGALGLAPETAGAEGRRLTLLLPEDGPERRVAWSVEEGALYRTSFVDPAGTQVLTRVLLIPREASLTFSASYRLGEDRPRSIGVELGHRHEGDGEPFSLSRSGRFYPRRAR